MTQELFSFNAQSSIYRETRGTEREPIGRTSSQMMSKINVAEEQLRSQISRMRSELDQLEQQLNEKTQTYSSLTSQMAERGAKMASAAGTRNELLQLMGHLVGADKLNELLAMTDED